MNDKLEAILAGLLMILAIGAILFVAMRTSADDEVWIPENSPVGPLVVRGNIYDIDGNPISDCSVIVDLYDINMTNTQTRITTTGSDGYYSVTFGINQWEIGGLLIVTAQIDGQAQQQAYITGNDPVITINVYFRYAIPEFGNWMGLLLVMLSMGMIILWFLRPKNGRNFSSVNDSADSRF